jgi:hypothetical protein
MLDKKIICLPNWIIEFYGLVEKSSDICHKAYIYSKGHNKSIEFRLFQHDVIDVFFVENGKDTGIKYCFDFHNKEDCKLLSEYIDKCKTDS